jgi:flagellar basal-body rod modification protein FlgD
MATVSSLPTSTTSSTGSSGTSSTSNSNSLASQQTFLQLLVAQLQNQDPTQPVEGTEFVTQLATFTNVQENLGVEQDVDAMSNKYLGYVPSGDTVVAAPATTSTTSSGTSSSGTSGTNSTSGS